MIRELVIYGDERLKQKSSYVENVDEEILTLIDDIISVPDFDDETKPDFKLALINPEIIWHCDETEILEEGCLSFFKISDDVARYKEIKVKYTDTENKEQILEAKDYIAKVLQHEIDHTNGITFIDRLESYQKRRLKKDLKELRNTHKKTVSA